MCEVYNLNPQMEVLRIATLNIQRATACDRINQVTNCTRRNKLDIVALQEVLFDGLPDGNSDFTLMTNVFREKAGTAFLLKSNLSVTCEAASADGRVLVAKLGNIKIVNVYAPLGNSYAQKRSDFFTTQMIPYLNQRHQTIMLGDLNAVTRKIDRKEGDRTTGKAHGRLIELITAIPIQDIWLTLRSREEGHTRFNHNGSARLDHIYATTDILPLVTTITEESVSFSDHHCGSIELKSYINLKKSLSPKENLWKLNCAVLKEEDYVEKMIRLD